MMTPAGRLLTRSLIRETTRRALKRRRPVVVVAPASSVEAVVVVGGSSFPGAPRQFGALTRKNLPFNTVAAEDNLSVNQLSVNHVKHLTRDNLSDWLSRWTFCITQTKKAVASPVAINEWFQENGVTPDVSALRLLLQGSLFYPWKKGRADIMDAFLCDILEYHTASLPENSACLAAGEVVENEAIVLQFARKVMSAWIRSKKTAQAEKWLKTLEDRDQSGVTPDGLTYTVVLKAWSKAGSPRKAEAILDLILEKCPGEVTKADFEHCLQAWAKSREKSAGSRAELLVLKMQDHYDPCFKSFLKVVEAWVESRSRRDAAARAQSVLELMQARYTPKSSPEQVRLLLQAYLQVMKAWSFYRGGQVGLEKTRALNAKLMEHPELLDEFTPKHGLQLYTHLLTALTRSAEIPNMAEYAETLVREEITDRGIPVAWKTETYNALLNVYAKAGDGPRAEKVLQRMLQSMVEQPGDEVSSAAPDTKTFNAVLLAYSKTKSAQRAEELFLLLQQLPTVEPDVVTYNALLSAMGGSSDVKIARRGQEYFAQLQERYMATHDRALRPSPVTYAQAMLLWSGLDTREAVEQAEVLLADLLAASQIKPTAATYRAFLTVLRNNSHVPNKGERIRGIEHAIRML